MRRTLTVLGSLLVVAALVFITRRAETPPATTTAVVGDRLFDAVFARVRASSVDPLDDAELYRRAAQGLIGELDDPYAFLELPGEPRHPAADQALPQGLYLDRREGRAIVVATVEGSPAAAAGLRPGDVLVGIDTTAINGNRLETAASLLAGRIGSTVTLRVRRNGAPVTSELRRGPVPRTSSVEVADLGGGIARVQLNRIDGLVPDSVRLLVDRLRRDGIRSLVLDLRGTTQGGDDLAAGARVADLFLEKGTVIAVSRMRRASGSENLTDANPSAFEGMPLAVLIDGGTAGAAEVIAGALQDHDRAIVLGSESYGRGATSSRFSLGSGAVLTLTTALWFTPSGRQIQRPTPVGDGPAPRDSVPRPTTRSDGGRVLTGGGGIVPDRIIPDPNGEIVLAEARRILLRASTPEAVFALVPQ
jgi:carboxyl-terminal processing protease